MTTKIVKLIYTDEGRRGDGKRDPIRMLPSLYSLDGELICQYDMTDPNLSRVSDSLYSVRHQAAADA